MKDENKNEYAQMNFTLKVTWISPSPLDKL